MDDSLLVGGIEAIGDLDREVQQFSQPFPRFPSLTLFDALPQCPAFQQLHHDDWLLFILSELVDRTDVAMIQR